MKTENYPLLALIGLLIGISLLWMGVSSPRMPLPESTDVIKSPPPKIQKEKGSMKANLAMEDLRVPLAANGHLLPEQMAMAQEVKWKSKAYDSYVIDTRVMDLALHWKDKRGKAFGNFSRLENYFTKEERQLLFAMNAGPFLPFPKGNPMGLFVENGKVRSPLNLNEGIGHFFKKPNGVFFVGERGTGIIESSQYPRLDEKIFFATQSGPILVYRGNIHPDFDPSSTNRYIRSGVGLIAQEEIVFVVSKNPVNFYEFAELFQKHFLCKMALYLDGAQSDMYMPELGRFSMTEQELGPLISVSRPLK